MSDIYESRLMDVLRRYLHDFQLPLMQFDPWTTLLPPPGHKSHKNHLNVRPEVWRNLENIYPIEIDDILWSWLQTRISVEITDGHLDETLHSPYIEDFSWHSTPTDILSLVTWIDKLMLTTTQRIMHLIYPDTRDWAFYGNIIEDRDSEIFQYFIWKRGNDSLSRHPQMMRDASRGGQNIAIVVQPPWILSAQDMKEFAESKLFPPCYLPSYAFPASLVSKHRVWAKLWDLCVHHKSPWFVLTSYNQWVFGTFSPAWSSGFVTSVYDIDNHQNTILEYLIFWAASAMGRPGTCPRQKVPEPVQNISTTSERMRTVYDQIPITESESGWDGKSAEPSSSAGAWFSSQSVSETGYSALVTPRNRERKDGHDFVREWMKNTEQTSPRAIILPEILHSSESSVRRLLFNNAPQGDWLN